MTFIETTVIKNFLISQMNHFYGYSTYLQKEESSPGEVKIPRSTPIFKGGDANELGKYRPVSVLPCFSKILERIMYNRLFNQLTKNKIETR